MRPIKPVRTVSRWGPPVTDASFGVTFGVSADGEISEGELELGKLPGLTLPEVAQLYHDNLNQEVQGPAADPYVAAVTEAGYDPKPPHVRRCLAGPLQLVPDPGAGGAALGENSPSGSSTLASSPGKAADRPKFFCSVADRPPTPGGKEAFSRIYSSKIGPLPVIPLGLPAPKVCRTAIMQNDVDRKLLELWELNFAEGLITLDNALLKGAKRRAEESYKVACGEIAKMTRAHARWMEGDEKPVKRRRGPRAPSSQALKENLVGAG